jgi:CheY-like chemotaxis protein
MGAPGGPARVGCSPSRRAMQADAGAVGPAVGRPASSAARRRRPAPEEARREEHDRAQEREHAVHGEPQDAERQEHEPRDRVEDEREERERPAQDEEQDPREESEHFGHLTPGGPAYFGRGAVPVDPRGTSALSQSDRMEPCRILVVDDNDAIRENLAELLEAEGYAVTIAADGAGALAALEREPLPQVVVLDLLMPGIDGREVTARIRGDARLGGVRVVLTTGMPSPSLRASVAADAFVAKPFGMDDLLRTISALCDDAAA